MTLRYENFLEPEELKEINLYPIVTIDHELPPARLRLRQEIGKKIMLELERLGHIPDHARDGFRQYPMWKFYTNKDASAIRRMCGIAAVDDYDKCHLSMITFMMLINNFVADVPAEECVALDDWTVEHKRTLCSATNKTMSVFWDPLGFIFADSHWNY